MNGMALQHSLHPDFVDQQRLLPAPTRRVSQIAARCSAAKFDVTGCMLQPPLCAWSHTSLSHLQALWMQVQRHLQGERDIPNQSDFIKIWVQEYKVLLRQTEQRMKDSVHNLSSQAQSETEGATTTPPCHSQLLVPAPA